MSRVFNHDSTSNASLFSSRSNSLPTRASTTATSTKVMVCSDNDNDGMFRLFVKIPKCFRKKDLREAFLKFGEIENVQIILNRLTNENKGFGYVRYYKATDAARALEQCNLEFKAQYAEPYSAKLLRDKKSKNNLMQNSIPKTLISATSIITAPLTTAINNNRHQSIKNNNNNSAQKNNPSTQQNNIFNYDLLLQTSSVNDQCKASLLVRFSSLLPGQNLCSFFEILPGLLDIKVLDISTANEIYYEINFQSNMWASHAERKLNYFPYPTGEIIALKDHFCY